MYRKNLFRYFLLLHVLLGQYCYGQKDSQDTLFNRFRNDVITEQKIHNGRIVMDDETRESYYLLISTYSIDSLIKHTDDPIPFIRSEIFSGLAQKNADEQTLRKIYNSHLNDTALINYVPTDVIIYWTVKEDMQVVMNVKAENKLTPIDFKVRLEKIRNERYRVIPGTYHGIIAKDSLLKIDRLTCSIGAFKIISFDLTIREKTIRSNNVITPRIKRKIRRLKSGERVYIEGIKAEGPDKVERLLNPAILIIK